MRVFRTLGGKAIIKETDPLATQARILSWPPGRRCVPYMESGRQRWLSGTLDISDDLTGCNGPCPGTPLANGDPSAALAVQGAATLRELAPPSGFTGKLHLMVQAMYGTKRTDMQSAGDGEIMVSDVLFGHSWEQSTVLYTDESGEYWLLQLGGMETATIQKWVPNKCGLAFDAATIDSEAYRLATLMPSGGEVAIGCTDGRDDIGEPFAYGWHAARQGNAGHVVTVESVMVEGDEHELLRTRLCGFILQDSGAVQEEGQSWEDYVYARFSVAFEVVTETDPFRIWYLWRIQIPNFQSGLNATVLRDGTGAGIDLVTVIEDAPLYCRYDSDDVLSVVTYSFDFETAYTEVDTNWPVSCLGEGTHIEYTHKNIAGGFFLEEYEPPDTAAGKAFSSYEGHTGSDETGGSWSAWLNYGLDVADYAEMACEEGAVSAYDDFIGSLSGNCTPGSEYIPKIQLVTGTRIDSFLYQTKKHYVQQILMIPFGNHEAVHLHALDATSCFRDGFQKTLYNQPTRVTALAARGFGCYEFYPELVSDEPVDWSFDPCFGCNEPATKITVEWTIPSMGSPDPFERQRQFGLTWNRTIHSYARHDHGTLRQEYSGDEGEITCDAFPYEFDEVDELDGNGKAPEWFRTLEETWFTRYNNIPPYFGQENASACVLYANDMSEFYTWYGLPSNGVGWIQDLESYQHGHRLAWFTGDKSIEAHDGYDEFVEDGCFVGAS